MSTIGVLFYTFSPKRHDVLFGILDPVSNGSCRPEDSAYRSDLGITNRLFNIIVSSTSFRIEIDCFVQVYGLFPPSAGDITAVYFKKTAMASSNNREDAPLLTDDAPNDVESDGGDVNNEEASKQEGARAWLQKAWHWALNNLMIIALGLLLLGGIVALIVYFAGILPMVSSYCLISNLP